MTKIRYEIIDPEPGFIGYCWHDPSTDPTQWIIEINAKELSKDYPVWILWPRGEVYVELGDDAIYVGKIVYDEEKHYSFARRDYKERGEFDVYLDTVEEVVSKAVEEYAKEWPTEEQWRELFPNGGAIMPPITK
jgi:hypothetical protein